MTARLGTKQRALLADMTTGKYLVVPDRLSRSLCARGLMAHGMPDGFLYVTATGLRAVADEMDAGRINPVAKLAAWKAQKANEE